MTYLTCAKCGSEEFTADVIYNTTIKLLDDGAHSDPSWEQVQLDRKHGELDKGSVQCLNCGEEKELTS